MSEYHNTVWVTLTYLLLLVVSTLSTDFHSTMVHSTVSHIAHMFFFVDKGAFALELTSDIGLYKCTLPAILRDRSTPLKNLLTSRLLSSASNTTSFHSKCKNPGPLQRQQLCLHDPEMTLYGRECLPGLTLVAGLRGSSLPLSPFFPPERRKTDHGLSASAIVGSLGRGICYGLNWPKRSNMTYAVVACSRPRAAVHDLRECQKRRVLPNKTSEDEVMQHHPSRLADPLSSCNYKSFAAFHFIDDLQISFHLSADLALFREGPFD